MFRTLGRFGQKEHEVQRWNIFFSHCRTPGPCLGSWYLFMVSLANCCHGRKFSNNSLIADARCFQGLGLLGAATAWVEHKPAADFLIRGRRMLLVQRASIWGNTRLVTYRLVPGHPIPPLRGA